MIFYVQITFLYPLYHDVDISYGQINNAGINKGFRPLTQFSDDDIQEVSFLEIEIFVDIMETHYCIMNMEYIFPATDCFCQYDRVIDLYSRSYPGDEVAKKRRAYF